MPDADEPEKRKRKPGRRPALVRSKSLTITLPPEDMARLLEQKKETGRDRSELLRRAWQGLPLTPRAKWTVRVVGFYRELVKLVKRLETIAENEQYESAVQLQAKAALDQVQQFMRTINEGDTQ